MNGRPRRRPPARTHPYWVLFACGICVAFLLLILLHPDLREQRFAQSIAGMLLALLVAVVLFSLFPPAAGLPIAIGTATGFYLFLFPKVQGALFPTREILGTVTYRNSLREVPGVRVRVRNSGQVAVTDTVGEFVLRRVASDVSELVFSTEGFDTVAALAKNGLYDVIPVTETVETLSRPLPPQSWREESGNACPQEGEPTRLYVLTTSVAVDPNDHPELRGRQIDGVILNVRVSPVGRGRILDAQSVGPLDGWEDNPSAERPNWKWSFPLKGRRDAPVRLEVCYSDQGSRSSVLPLAATYWIQARSQNNARETEVER